MNWPWNRQSQFEKDATALLLVMKGTLITINQQMQQLITEVNKMATREELVAATAQIVDASNKIVAAADAEAARITEQTAAIAALQAQIAAGGAITAEDLQPIVDNLNATAATLSAKATEDTPA